MKALLVLSILAVSVNVMGLDCGSTRPSLANTNWRPSGGTVNTLQCETSTCTFRDNAYTVTQTNHQSMACPVEYTAAENTATGCAICYGLMPKGF